MQDKNILVSLSSHWHCDSHVSIDRGERTHNKTLTIKELQTSFTLTETNLKIKCSYYAGVFVQTIYGK